MTPEQIAEQVAGARDRVRFDGGAEVVYPYDADQALVALADIVETHLATIERVEAKVRPGGVLDRADLDAREAARDALRRAVRR